MQKEINQTWNFNQSPEEVWEYLTKPELMEQWLMPNNFKLAVGHEFQFTCTKITYCKVLEIIPNKLLSYSWKIKNSSDELTVDSKVIWTLFERDGGTELKLVHNGFNTPEDFTGHNNGWTTLGKQFIELINKYKNANANT